MENQGWSLAQSKKGIKINVLGPPTSKIHNLVGEIEFFASPAIFDLAGG
ncbi:MAG: hypothetical protein GY797_38500 [Deltaproteobacteria bacterium]|nr:hypothetical protein [Deltaproteobacteria bacterium]